MQAQEVTHLPTHHNKFERHEKHFNVHKGKYPKLTLEKKTSDF